MSSQPLSLRCQSSTAVRTHVRPKHPADVLLRRPSFTVLACPRRMNCRPLSPVVWIVKENFLLGLSLDVSRLRSKVIISLAPAFRSTITEVHPTSCTERGVYVLRGDYFESWASTKFRFVLSTSYSGPFQRVVISCKRLTVIVLHLVTASSGYRPIV